MADFSYVSVQDDDELESLLEAPTSLNRGAKEGRGTKAKNTVDTAIQCYVNPGAWTGGRTDFAVVSGPDVILCSLKEPPPKANRVRGARITKTEPDYNPFMPARDFIFEARKVFPKLTFIAAYDAPADFEFTDYSDLLIFLPDMHMNFFRE